MRDQIKVNNGSDKVSHSVSLLKESGNDTSGLDGNVFECRAACLPPDTSHGHTEEGSNSQELWKGVDKRGGELECPDQTEIEDESPFSSETIGRNTKEDGADGSEKKGERDSGGNVCDFLVKLLRKSNRGQ